MSLFPSGAGLQHARMFASSKKSCFCQIAHFPRIPDLIGCHQQSNGGEYESTTHSLNLAVEAADGEEREKG